MRMKAILFTANKEKGKEVFCEKNLKKIRLEFDIADTIYQKSDIADTIYQKFDIADTTYQKSDIEDIIYQKEDVVSASRDFRDVDVMFSCWGVESFTLEEIQTYFPSLKCIFYVGGSVQYFARPFLESGVRICGSWQANAVAVAEYVVSQMILGIKGTFVSRVNRARDWDEKKKLVLPVKGFYGIKIGILGGGAIGRKVIELLSQFSDNQLELYLYSHSLTEEKAKQLHVKKASVEEIFQECDIISNHIANNPQTFGFYSSKQFDLMGEQVVFINSGRGQQVVERDLAEAMKKRPLSCALLDVTYPEPPEDCCPLLAVDNIFINPHIAGSQNNELERMVDDVLRDAVHFKNGENFDHEITLESLSRLA